MLEKNHCEKAGGRRCQTRGGKGIRYEAGTGLATKQAGIESEEKKNFRTELLTLHAERRETTILHREMYLFLVKGGGEYGGKGRLERIERCSETWFHLQLKVESLEDTFKIVKEETGLGMEKMKQEGQKELLLEWRRIV